MSDDVTFWSSSFCLSENLFMFFKQWSKALSCRWNLVCFCPRPCFLNRKPWSWVLRVLVLVSVVLALVLEKRSCLHPCSSHWGGCSCVFQSNVVTTKQVSINARYQNLHLWVDDTSIKHFALSWLRFYSCFLEQFWLFSRTTVRKKKLLLIDIAIGLIRLFTLLKQAKFQRIIYVKKLLILFQLL